MLISDYRRLQADMDRITAACRSLIEGATLSVIPHPETDVILEALQGMVPVSTKTPLATFKAAVSMALSAASDAFSDEYLHEEIRAIRQMVAALETANSECGDAIDAANAIVHCFDKSAPIPFDAAAERTPPETPFLSVAVALAASLRSTQPPVPTELLEALETTIDRHFDSLVGPFTSETYRTGLQPQVSP